MEQMGLDNDNEIRKEKFNIHQIRTHIIQAEVWFIVKSFFKLIVQEL